MPRTTYGSQIQKRVKRLLEALLCFVDREFEDSDLKIKYDWKDEDSANLKLTVQTTLVTLELLTQKDKYPGKLTKDQIREALNLLKDFLNILEDNRIQIKGIEEWRFTLKLWSRDREKNLKRFDETWENSRPKKSKELAATPEIKLALFQAPPLPEHFVKRPEYSDVLKTRLLASSSGNHTLVITAIHGLGSVGKSTIAAALAHNAEIQTRFCDGILWTTLGQQPDVLSLLSGWVQALGDCNFKPTSIEATSTHLRTLLYDKAVLLVVDDAWNTKDALVFNIGGVRCQVLVTTREGAIAEALGARTYSLDIMTAPQAMELLTKKLGREITGVERQSAENLAKGVGYLPLALELAAAQVASGTTWTVLLRDIQQEIARLKTLDRPGAKDTTDEASLKRLSLTASLNLSIKRLAQEDKEYFTWLGVLPEDVSITPKMMATLWDITDERDASDSLKDLQSKALLLLGVPLADSTLTYRLHDLFHDLARNLLTAPPQPRRGNLPGLGISLANAHVALLEKYQQKTQNGLWHTLPNDGYIHQYLVWHLEKAGQLEEIHELLREESATGNNGWYEVREKLGQTGGYITDVSRAWELAETNWTEATLFQVVGWQCRYALITASLNSLAANLPVKLLVGLIKNNIWTPEQGLAFALQNPNLVQKASSVIELVNYLQPNLKKLALDKALAAARAIQDGKYRTYTLIALANKLPEVLPEALTDAQAIEDELTRANALSILAEKMPEILPEALIAARAISHEYYCADALHFLADKMPQVLPEALATARAIRDEHFRAYALSDLADKIPEVLPEALAAARAIEDESHRANALSALINKMPEVLPEALVAARAIQDKNYRANALSALVNKMPEILPEALAAARAIQDKNYRANALSVLVNKMPEVLPEALAAVRSIGNEKCRAYAVCALADKIPMPSLLEALVDARAIGNEDYRAYALCALADKMPEILPEALAAVKAIRDEKDQANALCVLADKMPEILPEALAAAQSIGNEKYRANALCVLADKMPEILPEALAAVKAIRDEEDQANALCVLAEKMPEILPEALSAVKAIRDESNRANALSALINKMPEILPEALAAVLTIQSESIRVKVLRALANKLPLQLLPRALAAVKVIRDEKYRSDALIALVDKLPVQLLPETLAAVKVIQDEKYRSDALIALVDKLPVQLLPETLAAIKVIRDEKYRADALKALAYRLPLEFLPKALVTAKAIKNKKDRTNALTGLAEKMPELLPQALRAARAISNEQDRATALRALAEKMPELLPEALRAARAISNEQDRATALRALAEKMPELLPEALIAARTISNKQDRANPLKALVNKSQQEIIPEALVVVLAIQNEKSRAIKLSVLASGLSQMPYTTLFPFWQDTLHKLSLRTRPNLLQDIKALFPVIFALGGEAATAEIARAIVDVARWWR
ncbi:MULTISPECIES: NB-ARC domain-containing protein [unclassified Nostoc]|uniref:NB-ARC domain-containing protein n=1 Tax=unclassified Nostoc TaxID=2593658 RepID=UPI00261DCF25|nr:NB-ARC domain-containing protein [Nostoc sp. S13]MDF5739184.1 NB-ARC domain-containing protein [Nostoc sp. S13]